MGNVIDIKGRQFGFLTALEYEPTATAGGAMWHCRCVCGKEILALGTSLRRGDKKSCGCPDRYPACQDHCQKPERLAWKEEQEKIRAARQNYTAPTWASAEPPREGNK